MSRVTRRRFFEVTAVGSMLPLMSMVPRAHAANVRRWIEGGAPDNFPSQEYESVRNTVGKSHRDLEGVRELVTARPALARATWDWGFGDWETALGAASHTGQREIAALLMEHGARPDIFTFAMLGQVDVVRAVCIANPGIQKIHGPHGITLMQHAINGGDEAKPVVEYLQELGDADLAPEDPPLDDAAAKTYSGDYELQHMSGMKISIGVHERLKCLTLAVNDGSARFLVNRGRHQFSPRGVPAVQITFDVTDGVTRSLNIQDGDLMLVASRIGD